MVNADRLVPIVGNSVRAGSNPEGGGSATTDAALRNHNIVIVVVVNDINP